MQAGEAGNPRDQNGAARVRVTLKEGKYHQVRRMIAAVGGTVTALKRLRLGGLWLDKTLAPGEFRELTQEELEKLTSANPEKLKNLQIFLNFCTKMRGHMI